MTYKDIPGYCDFHDFYKQVFDSLTEHAIMAEVGVYLGHSVAYMASLSKESGKDIRIWAVDTFEGSEEHRRNGSINLYDRFNTNMLLCTGCAERVIDIKTDSVRASEALKDGSLDFVFIDAAHDYDNVKADIQAWLPKVKLGGIIAGHDYCDAWPGVKKAVDELIPDRQLTSKSVWWKRLEPTS